MSTSTRITRSKGESDGLSLPMRTRPTRKDTTSGRNGGTALNITGNAGRDQQQQMPTQMPHLTQLPQATSAEITEATTLMLPPGPHRPLTPCMPPPASPTSSSGSSAPLFKEDKYSSTSEEESEADAEVTFIHGRSNGTFANHQAKRPNQHRRLLITLLRVIQMHHLQLQTYLDQMLQMTNFWAQTIFSCQTAATDKSTR